MLNRIEIELNKRLNDEYGLEAEFFFNRKAIEKKLELNKLHKSKPFKDLIHEIGLPSLSIQFCKPKIQEIYRRYCTNRSEKIMFRNVLESYKTYYFPISSKNPNGEMRELIGEFQENNFIYDKYEEKLFWDLLSRIDSNEYSFQFLGSIFSDNKTKLKRYDAANIIGSKCLTLEFGSLHSFQLTIESMINETIQELEVIEIKY